MSEDELTKLFKYVEKRVDGLEKKIDSKASAADMERVPRLLDTLANV